MSVSSVCVTLYTCIVIPSVSYQDGRELSWILSLKKKTKKILFGRRPCIGLRPARGHGHFGPTLNPPLFQFLLSVIKGECISK